MVCLIWASASVNCVGTHTCRKSSWARKIGKSASTIGSYENDTAVPTLENAAALAEALHVSLDYLLYGEKSRTHPLQKMSENRVQLLTDLAQEFAAPTSHGAAFSDRKLDILRRLYQEFYR